MTTRTLLKRTALLETQSLSRVEELLTRHWRDEEGNRPKETEIRAQWKRTRERVGFTLAEEEAFGELLERIVEIAAHKEPGETEMEAFSRAFGEREEATPQEEQTASERLHAEPTESLRSYLKGLDYWELWLPIGCRMKRLHELINANPDRRFWNV